MFDATYYYFLYCYDMPSVYCWYVVAIVEDLCAIWCTDNWDQVGCNKDVVKPLIRC